MAVLGAEEVLSLRKVRRGSILVALCALSLLAGCAGPLPDATTESDSREPISIEGASLNVETPCPARMLRLSVRGTEPVADRPVDVGVWKDRERNPFVAVTIPPGMGTASYDVPMNSITVRILVFGARKAADRPLSQRIELISAEIVCETPPNP